MTTTTKKRYIFSQKSKEKKKKLSRDNAINKSRNTHNTDVGTIREFKIMIINTLKTLMKSCITCNIRLVILAEKWKLEKRVKWKSQK